MKGRWILMSVLILGLLLALAVGVIQAQNPEPEDDVSAGDIEPAAVTSIVPIQGRLTDASGNPLDGNYDITASIYDVGTGGTALCWDTDTVAVDNGLFNMDMNYCKASDIDGEQLYLGIQVGSDPEMTPRQPIHPVPYAWTVKPGAIIRGATTYLFTPGSAFVKISSGDSTRWVLNGAGALIYRGSDPGNKTILIPITIPSVLYGQPVRVTNVTVYYRCQNGGDNYITRTRLYKMTDADSWQEVVDDATDRTSSSATSYSLATNSNYNTLSASQGSLALYLYLDFANDFEYVNIGGVRLTLVTDY